MIIGKKIKQLREQKGLTQVQLAAQIGGGVKQQNIAQLEDGSVRQPRYLNRLLEVLGTSYNEIMSDKPIKAKVVNLKQKKDTVIIEQLSAVAGMGAVVSIDANHDSQISTVEMSKQFLESQIGAYSNPSNLKLINAVGRSMEGMFNSGDTLVVDLGVNRFISESVYVFHWDDSIWIKTLERDGHGGFDIVSENPRYKKRHVKRNDPSFRIIGMVMGVFNLQKLV